MAEEAYRSRIGSALASRDYAELESAWREFAGLHTEEHEYLLSVAEQLARQDKGALASELCVQFAQALQDKGENTAALAAARMALKANQRTEGLREVLVLAFQAEHGDNEHLDEFIQKAEVLEDTGNIRQQVDALDRYLTFAEGAYVYHAGGWGYGLVVEFDAGDEVMVVDFQRKLGHRMNLLSATKILKRLPPDHFGVYLNYRTDELKGLLKDDPARVFRIFLHSNNKKAQLKQLREAIVPDLLTKEEWSRWWNRAKKAILKDPAIRIGKGSSPLLELRDKAKPIEVEVAEKMRAHSSGLEQASIAREYLRNLDLTPALVEAIREVLDERLAAEPRSPAERLAILYLRADLKTTGSEEAAEEAYRHVSEAADLPALLAPLELADRKRTIQVLAEHDHEGWAETLVDVVRNGDVELADVAVERLGKARPDLLVTFFSKLATTPREHPALFLWYVRNFMGQHIPAHLATGETNDAAIDKLLTLTNHIGLDQKRTGDAEMKEFLRQVRSFLTARRMKTFNSYVEGVTLDYARFLFAKIQRNRGLTDQTKRSLMDVLEGHHPEIHTAGKARKEGEMPEDIIYTTLKGYHAKEAELRHIVEQEIPENAADLGRAASFGDISENAEYSAALEKQGYLMRRVQELRTSLEQARIIDLPENVEKVVIGTRVKVHNETRGLDESFSILGPWDVDLERGVISYLSPVGRGLLGKKLEDRTEIELPEGSAAYTVLAIESDPRVVEGDEDEEEAAPA
jgi:transcription elongation factor GreA